MTEVPKIVHHRLRAATPAPDVLARAHLDPNILTAFAEQALEASERDGVLQHLALCADCRDVVMLALPEVDTVTLPVEALPVEAETEGVVARAGAEHKRKDKEGRFSWASLGWAQLRWATLAAGIAVAVFVARPVLERTGKPDKAANQASAPSQPLSGSQVASAAPPANSVAPSLTDPSMTNPSLPDQDTAKRMIRKRVESAARSVESNSGAADAKSAFSAHRPETTPPAEAEMQLAGNRPSTVGGEAQDGRMQDGRMKDGRVKKDSVSAAMTAGPLKLRSSTATNQMEADKLALSESVGNSSKVGESATTVEVVAGASELATAEAAAEPTMMARADGLAVQNAPVQNAPKIEKAKPALDQATARDVAAGGKANGSQKTSSPAALASPSLASSQAEIKQAEVASNATSNLKAASASATIPKQSANWMVADGVLHRSLDGGHTWQTAARAGHALLCYANRGQEVWAGGKAGTLLHSVDNGATWSPVAVSLDGQSLSSDVTHLDIRGPAGIVLATDTHETWSSPDGGKTWEK